MYSCLVSCRELEHKQAIVVLQVNILFGGPQFLEEQLQQACNDVVLETQESRSEHVLTNGWYSHSVLSRLFDLTSPPVLSRQHLKAQAFFISCRGAQLVLRSAHEFSPDIIEQDSVIGVLVNQNNQHWTCVVL